MKTWKRSDITDLAVLFATAFRDQGEFITDALSRRYPNCPPKVLYAALERASRRGLVEYGVSLRSGWVTAEGVRVIGEAFGCDARAGEVMSDELSDELSEEKVDECCRLAAEDARGEGARGG